MVAVAPLATSSAAGLAPRLVIAVYLRVSGSDQHEENQLPDVERLLTARYPGAEIVWYREKKSATKDKSRPVFDRMLSDARAGRFTALVVWKLDRFGRTMHGNIRDLLALDAAGVGVVSASDPWLDTRGPVRELLIAIFSWVAAQEIATLKQRTKAGLDRIRAAGGVTHQQVYGLKIVCGEDDVPRAALDEAATPVLAKLAAMFCAGMSLRGVGVRLNAERAGGRTSWDQHRVKAILTDPRLRQAGAWSPELIASFDERLATLDTCAPAGAAKPAHLASSFVGCGVCGGGLTVKKSHGRGYYLCAKCQKGGTAACAGIGSRAKIEVDRALAGIVRDAISGDIMRRALEVARGMLEATPDFASEGQAVAAALTEAEVEGKRLAKMAAKLDDDDADELADEIKANADKKRQLRARLERLERLGADPNELDRRRKLATIERRLAELAKALDEGGLAARPACEAVLQGARLTALPVVIDGVRRWQLSGWISEGYLMELAGGSNGGASGSARAPPTRTAGPSPAEWSRASASETRRNDADVALSFLHKSGGAGNRTQVRNRITHASTYVSGSLYRPVSRLPAGSPRS